MKKKGMGQPLGFFLSFLWSKWDHARIPLIPREREREESSYSTYSNALTAIVVRVLSSSVSIKRQQNT